MNNNDELDIRKEEPVSAEAPQDETYSAEDNTAAEATEPVEETLTQSDTIAEESAVGSETNNAETENAEDGKEEVTDITEAAQEFEDYQSAEEPAADIKPAKKRPFIQIPVIVSICIVVIALIGYFVFNGFFLQEPEGVTWSAEYEGVTWYFEFNDNDVFKAYVGSVELTGTYEKMVNEGEKYIVVNANAGDFYAGQTAKYEITGSRILGNQVFSISYGDDYNYSYSQSKGRENYLEPPTDFTPDDELTDTWIFTYYGYDYCTVTFNANGTMKIEYTQNGIAYNGTYTIENGSVNFTYYVDDNIVQPIEYSVDGDVLTFMGMQFVRAGSGATVDEIAIGQ